MFDLKTQRRMHQAVSRFFLAMQVKFKVSEREMVMLMLASTYGMAKKVGLSTPQLIEWALKNWGECDRELLASPGALRVEGVGADATKAD